MSLEMDITRRFGSFTLNIRLEARKEILGIFGASGSGKSMTLGCLAGIITPDRGRIVLEGRILFDSERGINLPPRERRVGLMFQSYALFPRMTLRENIACGIRDRAGRDKKIREMTGLLRLEGLEDRYPGQLSGGQQQRAALARMLASEPEMIMLDEPFSALDRQLKDEIETDFLAALKTFDGPVLYVSHIFGEIHSFCRRSAVLSRGRVVELGETGTIFRSPETLETAALLRCENLMAAEPGEAGTLFVPGWNISLRVPGSGEHAGGGEHPGYLGLYAMDVLLERTEDGVQGKNRKGASWRKPAGDREENRFEAEIGGAAFHPREALVKLFFAGAAEPLIVQCSRAAAGELSERTGNKVAVIIPPERVILFPGIPAD